MNISKQQLIYGAGFLVVGLFLGWLLFSGAPEQDEHPDHERLSQEELNQHVQDAHTDDQGDIIYTCSMHPQVRENEPGNCPICGMDLIPVRSGETEIQEDDYSMMMTTAAVRLADIQTTPAIRSIPHKELDLPGRVQVDERRLMSITAHFSGRIRNLEVNFTGAPIRRGEPMASIYSPELISAQRELLEAARQQDRNPRLYESARQKFRLWEFTDEQIREIEERGEVETELDILSPADGYVLTRNVAEDQHVAEGTVLFEIASLDRVWVVLEAYEEDLDWISEGDAFSFSTRANPGRSHEATISYVDPVVDASSRTVRVRADLENSGGQLKPDMLVRARMESHMDNEKVLVPSSAVLWTGKRSLVYVRDTTAETPRFEARLVNLGLRSGDYYVIEEGVEEGEEVVFHGAFRIDSEMQLADRFSMMNREPGTGAVPVHDHGGMDMEEADDPVPGHEEHDEKTPGHEEHSDRLPAEAGPLEGVTEDFITDFRDFLQYYLDGKKALFEGDDEEIREAFRLALDELETIGVHRMDGDAHMQWMEHHEAAESHLNHILEAGDIESRREGFESLSHVMIEAVHSYGIPGVIYHQYCPMVDASWLSREEQIENPYAPDSMPSCGEIIERIEF